MNLLPAFATLELAKEKKNNTKWFPKTSLPTKKDFSYLGIAVEESKQNTSISQKDNVPTQALLPPNERYINNHNYSDDDPSPLGNFRR